MSLADNPVPAETRSAETDDVVTRARRTQRLAYDAALAVAAELRPGQSERDAAAALTAYCESRGIDGWFHRPFAWFGERTAFVGMKLPTAFFPTARKLERGMPFILDLAPILDGAVADIGYAACLGEHELHARMRRDLMAYRTLILEGVRERRSLAQIYADVDELAALQGWVNRHRKYPFGVLAHRVDPIARAKKMTVGGFSVSALQSLGIATIKGLREGWSPLWNGTRRSDHPATPGLWAVEPHLGFGGVGVKFEELMVVRADGTADWLDDDLPHVRAAA
jgi:Xaa-Pro aminopeptidase